VIHDEASSYHDVDEEPTMAEYFLFAQVTESNESRHQKEDNFHQVIHEEAPAHYDADTKPMSTEDSLFGRSAGPKRASTAKSASINDELDNDKTFFTCSYLPFRVEAPLPRSASRRPSVELTSTTLRVP
jgi:hypothetical protein